MLQVESGSVLWSSAGFGFRNFNSNRGLYQIQATSVSNYQATSVSNYQATSVSNYQDTSVPNYQDTRWIYIRNVTTLK